MKRKLFIIIAILPVLSLMAQKPSGKAYPKGIYVFCGTEIPRDFHYLVEKKNAAGQWENAAELRAPGNAAALKANLLMLPAYFSATMPLPMEQSDHIWTRLSKSLAADSLYDYAADPKILVATGCGWFDDGLTASGTYQYRVSKVIQTDAIVLGELSVPFPQNSFRGTLATWQFRPDDNMIAIYYGLSDSIATYSLKLYRSRLKENDFREIPARISFTSLDGRKVAMARDESVTKGLVYSYVAIPYDALGNMGTSSDTINIYNLSNVADLGTIKMLTAVADRENRGVTLRWRPDDDVFYVAGYELFRSRNYDDGYIRIASLPATTTVYFDENVDPADPYYYIVAVNNGYGVGPPSIRTPVILEGTEPNIFPPQNVEATISGNLVQLTFNNIESDTREYQIYRGEGYTGELRHIATLTTRDSLVVFTDTLARSINPQTWSYAVADVNTSNNVSPVSERVTIQYGGGMLSVPSITEVQLRGNEIFVVWDNMSQQNAFIAGYNVYRSAVSLPEGGGESEPQIYATLSYDVNHFIDTLLIPGTHYRYAIESVDLNGETSGMSMYAGIIVPAQPPLPPGQITAIATDNSILLRWDNPFDPSIKAIRIYRATLNTPAVFLKELPENQTTFEDETAKQGEQYFYYVVTVNGRGEESRADEPVSGRVRI